MAERRTRQQDLPEGIRLSRRLKLPASCGSIAWSHNGNFLAAPLDDSSLWIWDTASWEARNLKTVGAPADTVCWSPDSRSLLTADKGGKVKLVDPFRRRQFKTFDVTQGRIRAVTWVPHRDQFAVACKSTVYVWDLADDVEVRRLSGHKEEVFSLAWSSSGQMLASVALDGSACLWDMSNGELIERLTPTKTQLLSVCFHPTKRLIAIGAADGSIHLWAQGGSAEVSVLEGHKSPIAAIAFSPDGKLLASMSIGDGLRFWDCATWAPAASIDNGAIVDRFPVGLCFHPHYSILGISSANGHALSVLDLDISAIVGRTLKAVRYTNTKIVLVGDSGVGKTGLGLVLSGSKFRATESTHGRRVWTFSNYSHDLGNGLSETREVLLWDLAGQPGYRLVHQFSLSEVAVALVVFDAKSETDPFSAVRYWDRALRQARFAKGTPQCDLIKFLVAARTDRGSINVSRERIEELVRTLGFHGFFVTSAKENLGIWELSKAIREIVDWSKLPKGSSTELFQNIKAFIVEQKKSGQLLRGLEDFCTSFLETTGQVDSRHDVSEAFRTCVGLLEARGIIRMLSFGGLVLLQPELLDSYASALINAARLEPDGLGSIAVEQVREGAFFVPREDRVRDESEPLLLLSTMEELLKYEIALREDIEGKAYLIFPSQFTRDWPEAPDPEGKAITFGFEGPVMNVYSTLVVRLSRSGAFTRRDLWRNAALFVDVDEKECGIWLKPLEDGRGEVTLFFQNGSSRQSRGQLEEYVYLHLLRRAIPESVHYRRIYTCRGCLTPVTDLQAKRRRERGFSWIQCSVCGMRVDLTDQALRYGESSEVSQMDQAADSARDAVTSATVLQGKVATAMYDVFLCYNSTDRSEVKEIGEDLKRFGILPWLDEWELPPGQPWQNQLERQIRKIRAAAVFIGSGGRGPWQNVETQLFISQFVRRRCPVIPVLLKEARKVPKLPLFLGNMTWVDFRLSEPDPLARLIWGITGKKIPTS